MGQIYRNVAVSVLESHSRPSVTPWPVAAEQACTWCGLPAALWSEFGIRVRARVGVMVRVGVRVPAAPGRARLQPPRS